MNYVYQPMIIILRVADFRLLRSLPFKLFPSVVLEERACSDSIYLFLLRQTDALFAPTEKGNFAKKNTEDPDLLRPSISMTLICSDSLF